MFRIASIRCAAFAVVLTAASLGGCSSSNESTSLSDSSPTASPPSTEQPPQGQPPETSPEQPPSPPPPNPPESAMFPLPADNGEVITLPGGISVAVPDRQESAGMQMTAQVLREYEVPTMQPEGIVFDPLTQAFYGGSTSDGSVYRATLDGTVTTFLPVGRDGSGKPDTRASVQGLRVDGEGRLYVAGGPTGILHVYQLPGGEKIGTFPTLPGAYLNDIAVTSNGDVYVTDSVLPFIYRFSEAQIASGAALPQQIATIPETGALNLAGDVNPIEANGISETPDGRFILFNNTDDHALYRLSKPVSDPAAVPVVTGADREIVKLNIDGDLGDTDGQIFLDTRTLYVMDNDGEAISKVVLNADYTRGTIVAQSRSERFHTPSGIAIAPGGVLLVTNAELFDQSEPLAPFFVTAVPQF